MPRRYRSVSGNARAVGRIGGHRLAVLAGEAGEWLQARLAARPGLTMGALTAELAARVSLRRMTLYGGL